MVTIHPQINIVQEKISTFCQRWNITELALFGSGTGTDFDDASDIDLLVTFSPKSHITLFDMVHMQDELEEIFGRDVNLVSRRGIENSRNYLRRDAILSSLEIIYAT